MSVANTNGAHAPSTIQNATAAPPPPSNLFPVHLTELTEGSGLTLDTIEQAGIYSEGDNRKLAVILDRKKFSPKMLGGLVFPFFDETGAVVTRRVKPTNPPTYSGKVAKYLSPNGSGVRVYIPLPVFPRLSDPKSPLFITEGEKKALCATQNGFHCIGLTGVEAWHKKGSISLLPDLARVEWRDRQVYICFDSDAASNDDVLVAEQKLAAALSQQGAKVLVMRLPPASDGGKQGVDDFIVAKGAAAFNALLCDALEAELPDIEDGKGDCRNADPAIEADAIIDSCRRTDGLCRLVFWQGSFYRWKNGCYTEVPKAEMNSQTTNNLNQRWLGVRKYLVADILHQISAKTTIPSTVAMPSWLAGQPKGFDPAACLATKNKIIHLPRLAVGDKDATVTSSPNYFTTNAIDYSFDDKAAKPKVWIDFLQSIWPDDQQSIDTLQEVFGYLLTPDTSQQKIFMFIGPTRGGKGVIARAIKSMISERNIAGPTLSSLAGQFGLQPLLGKSVATISDARLSGRTDQAAVLERLLSVSGEDTQTVERKHMTSVTCKLPTRFVIISNELPRLNDSSAAIVGRLIFFRTTISFLGREDRQLDNKLKREREGILQWAIDGWIRLDKRGYFQQPDSGLEHLSELRDLASPESAFVRQCCEVRPGLSIPCCDLFASWTSWCETQGRTHSGSLQSFSRNLLAAVPTVVTKQKRDSGKRIRIYEGIGRPGQDY